MFTLTRKEQIENNEEFMTVATRLNELIDKKAEATKHIEQMELSTHRLEEIKKLVDTEAMLDKYDDDLSRQLLEKVLVINQFKVEYHFKCGVSIIVVI